MTTQLNPSDYAQCIQYTLSQVFSPVPVYASFNRNWATQEQFVTWQLRNIHQPVYTGQTQDNKGIDRPIFQTSIFTKDYSDAFDLSNVLLDALHGYSGIFGDPDNNGFFVAKIDIMWLYNGYDNDLGMNQIFLDCTMDVPA